MRTLLKICLCASLVWLTSCSDDEKDGGWPAENSTCLTSSCHGNPSLQKLIVVTGGATETVPLFVDSAQYVAQVHRNAKCTDCHTDITVDGGSHSSASKVFGGWARFSAKSGTVALATPDSTRNYGTAASTACANCHAEQHNPNSAHIKIPRLHTSIRNIGGHAVGENYEDNNCGRCHATCATCHFKSNITPRSTAHADLLVQANWDGVQTSGDNYNGVNWGLATEWDMDWTANVSAHGMRSADTLRAANDVCRSCHIGYYRPAQLGFAMRASAVDSMMATGIKRHPQFQELALGSVHGGTTCATCHGASLHDQESIEGGPECIDCHAGKDANHPAITNHMNLANNVKIKCIACHTKHRASDFNNGYLSGGHNNWINPEVTTHTEIGPVTVKYSELLNWYPHYFSKEVACTPLCHFSGNRVGAHVLAGAPAGPFGYLQPYVVTVPNGDTDE